MHNLKICELGMHASTANQRYDSVAATVSATLNALLPDACLYTEMKSCTKLMKLLGIHS
jgi:hypothetical protein